MREKNILKSDEPPLFQRIFLFINYENVCMRALLLQMKTCSFHVGLSACLVLALHFRMFAFTVSLRILYLAS